MNCTDQQCLANFDGQEIREDVYITNVFKTFILLIGYMSTCFPTISILITAVSSIQMFGAMAFLGVFLMQALTNPKRVPLLQANINVNTITWWKDQLLPILLSVWFFWVSSIVINFNYVGFSALSATLIVLHVWAEFPLMVIFAILIRQKITDWAEALKINLILIIFFIINLALVASTANPYIQGIYDLLAIVADVGNPIALTIFLKRNYTSLTKRDKFRFVMLTLIFWNHLITFYVAGALCMVPYASAVFYATFLIVGTVLSFIWMIHENITFQSNAETYLIPTIF